MPKPVKEQVLVKEQIAPLEKGIPTIKDLAHQPVKPTTTHQQDLTTAGQRRVNLIWEFTQAVIAVMITTATIYCAVKQIPMDILTNAFFLIVSMYFVRTNHTLIGGVGIKHGDR